MPRSQFHDSFEYYGAQWTPDFFKEFQARRGYDLRSQLPASTRVQVDGGINGRTALEAREAGADLLVAGSAIFWNDHPGDAYRQLAAAIAEPARG